MRLLAIFVNWQQTGLDDMSVCYICNNEINSGSFLGTIGDGTAHSLCHYKQNPPKIRVTFAEVLNNRDDQVLVRQLVDKHMPTEKKVEIIDDFNREIQVRHQRRIAI